MKLKTALNSSVLIFYLDFGKDTPERSRSSSSKAAELIIAKDNVKAPSFSYSPLPLDIEWNWLRK